VGGGAQRLKWKGAPLSSNGDVQQEYKVSEAQPGSWSGSTQLMGERERERERERGERGGREKRTN
jgi:hypothetical protein